MSKYWKKSEEAMKYDLFKNWHDAADAPKTGEYFMGHKKGSNIARATFWSEERQCFLDREGCTEICQWISFDEFADIRACVWRG